MAEADLTVVTGNPNKAKEVAAFFGDQVNVAHVKLDLPEYRDNDVGKIAALKAEAAYEAVGRPVIVDDTGFYIAALNGFPGAYAAYVLDTIGMDGILKLMSGVSDRSAYFETAIAYKSGDVERLFRGRVDGLITESARGDGGFGYDPIFEVEGRTFAEILIEEKSKISHRGLALLAFSDWFRYEHGF
ncbi:RdgB/HAM1 family non-canonical purine NTP pyrophosphatase [Methanoplanus endosymbiosus]|uniref:dITP/XTP pyrophosphatase n=1 Tax=Methanoplanus endosymbiosus TaxID=33865 RepID=A0A9E7PPH0_9EURY|nr:RdgB/HAM1 family non-canonical purine NTP pyrophosphatase [Methanoplanus endosymbiosus]UUX91237.1 RdgB/HAM1 family non-canonical purine NTP pyrophosphatase [Methanoplanus endosymbiosus]